MCNRKFFTEAASLRPDARKSDHLRPFLDFVRNELAEVGRRADKLQGSHVGEPRLDLGIGQSCVELPIELVDNLDGRVHGSAGPERGQRDHDCGIEIAKRIIELATNGERNPDRLCDDALDALRKPPSAQ
jgi:hypothetical protein